MKESNTTNRVKENEEGNGRKHVRGSPLFERTELHSLSMPLLLVIRPVSTPDDGGVRRLTNKMTNYSRTRKYGQLRFSHHRPGGPSSEAFIPSLEPEGAGGEEPGTRSGDWSILELSSFIV